MPGSTELSCRYSPGTFVALPKDQGPYRTTAGLRSMSATGLGWEPGNLPAPSAQRISYRMMIMQTYANNCRIVMDSAGMNTRHDSAAARCHCAFATSERTCKVASLRRNCGFQMNPNHAESQMQNKDGQRNESGKGCEGEGYHQNALASAGRVSRKMMQTNAESRCIYCKAKEKCTGVKTAEAYMLTSNRINGWHQKGKDDSNVSRVLRIII